MAKVGGTQAVSSPIKGMHICDNQKEDRHTESQKQKAGLIFS